MEKPKIFFISPLFLLVKNLNELEKRFREIKTPEDLERFCQILELLGVPYVLVHETVLTMEIEVVAKKKLL